MYMQIRNRHCRQRWLCWNRKKTVSYRWRQKTAGRILPGRCVWCFPVPTTPTAAHLNSAWHCRRTGKNSIQWPFRMRMSARHAETESWHLSMKRETLWQRKHLPVFLAKKSAVLVWECFRIIMMRLAGWAWAARPIIFTEKTRMYIWHRWTRIHCRRSWMNCIFLWLIPTMWVHLGKRISRQSRNGWKTVDGCWLEPESAAKIHWVVLIPHLWRSAAKASAKWEKKMRYRKKCSNWEVIPDLPGLIFHRCRLQSCSGTIQMQAKAKLIRGGCMPVGMVPSVYVPFLLAKNRCRKFPRICVTEFMTRWQDIPWAIPSMSMTRNGDGVGKMHSVSLTTSIRHWIFPGWKFW